MPRIFQDGNDELENLIQTPSLENLIAYFDARTSEWSEPLISTECFTVGVFYDLTQSFKGPAAFDLLALAPSINTDCMADEIYMRFIDLLSDLATGTNTTEMPKQLQQEWDGLIERAASIDAGSVGLQSLKRHYRIVG